MANRGSVGRRTHHRREPVLVLVDDLAPALRDRDGGQHIRGAGRVVDGGDVGLAQVLAAAEALADSARGFGVAGRYVEDVGAERVDLALDGGRGAVADRDQHDHSPHPDQDSQHRQGGTEAVGEQALEGQPERRS